MEEWKDILGYEGYYQVSNLGRVKSFPRKFTIKKERILVPRLQGNKGREKYEHIWLSKNNNKITMKIHRLVAQAFIPNPESKPHINHKDFNPRNNKVENLEWCTHRENMQHAFINNRIATGEKHYKAKLNWEKVGEIRKKYSRRIPQSQLATDYGVNIGTIWFIVHNKTWVNTA